MTGLKGKDEKEQNNKEWSSSRVKDVVCNSKKQEGSWAVAVSGVVRGLQSCVCEFTPQSFTPFLRHSLF